MEKLYLLLTTCTILAYLYEHCTIQWKLKPKKIELIYFALMTIMICFGGFRGSYNDTWTYRDAYVYLIKGFPEDLDIISWELGDNPAFLIIESILKTFDVEVHLFIMFFFFWTTLFYMHFVKKYSVDLTLTVYLFFTMGCYSFNMAAMKQCIATAFCLLAIPYAIEKKYFRFLLLICFAALFHPYALMYIIVPFLDFSPWKIGTFVVLVGIVVVGVLFQPLLGTVISITTAIGEEYTIDTFSGDGVGILRLVVVWSPVVLSFIYRKVLYAQCDRKDRIFFHLTIVYAGILFVGLFGTALYFGRLSNYFSMMPVITLPWMIKKINYFYPRDSRIITIVVVICYFIFFYFSHTIESDFASSYEALTLIDFLRIFFGWLKGEYS